MPCMRFVCACSFISVRFTSVLLGDVDVVGPADGKLTGADEDGVALPGRAAHVVNHEFVFAVEARSSAHSVPQGVDGAADAFGIVVVETLCARGRHVRLVGAGVFGSGGDTVSAV